MFATTGFYRNSSVTTRGETTSLHCVPGAHIRVTETATGAPANIYSDPQMTKLISNSTVVSDLSGNYDYYIPLNYMVTENISSPGGRITIPNIGVNTR
jgi:hypothetical protein